MFQRISKLALAAAAGLFLFAAACGVEASGTSGADELQDRTTAPTATPPTPQNRLSGFSTSTPSAFHPLATKETDDGSDAQATVSPGTPAPLPLPTPEPPANTSPTPTPGIGNPPSTPLQQTPTPAVVACGSGPVLTHPPMEDGTFENITPLGNLAPPSHTFPTGHMYFGLPFVETGLNDGPFGDGMVFPPQSVYAAADSRIASLAVANVTSTLSGSTESYLEFDLQLEICDGIWIRYGHIGPLSERLQALVDGANPDWCNSYGTGPFQVERCEYAPNWQVEAGELIAYTSGRTAAFDFGASRSESSGGGSRISECPLDLYDDERRVQFEQLLGTDRTPRTVAPLCGTAHQDVLGTAQGRWFKSLDGNPGEDQNLALVHDNIDPGIPVFSIGISMPGVQSNAYRFVPSATGNVNRDFEAVMPEFGVICYQNLTDRWGNSTGLTLLIDMPDETTLRIESVQQGSCDAGPWSLSANAVSYYR